MFHYKLIERHIQPKLQNLYFGFHTNIPKFHQAQRIFILTLVASIISLLAAIFTMVYARSKVFIPLIQARSQILRLAAYDDEAQGTQNPDKVTLLEGHSKIKTTPRAA